MSELKPGILGEARTVVSEANTAITYGSGSVPVLATPAMIALMEKAALESVQPFLPEGMTTVGTRVKVKHLAATPVGMEVVARSELMEVDGRKLKFKVTAYDGKELIGEGEHTRYIVETEKFVVKAQAKRE